MTRLPRARTLARGLAALAAAGGLVVSVSACEVKPGAAAFVGDERITEAEVSGYLNDSAVDPSQQSGTNPRNLVLSSLVRTQLWTDYLRANGGVPSDSELASRREPALQQVFQSGTAPSDAQVVQALGGVGLDRSFAPVFVRESELLYTVVEDITQGDTSSTADIAKIVTEASPKVRLSPRYGTWNTTTLNLEASNPPYLQLSGGSTGA